MTLKNTYFVSRQDIVEGGIGITRRDVEKAVRCGALEVVVLPGRRYGKYRRTDVLRVFQITNDDNGGSK